MPLTIGSRILRPSYTAAGGLVLTGVVCLVVAVTHQQVPVQVPLAVRSSTSPAAVTQVSPPASVAAVPVAAPTSLVIPAIHVRSELLTLGQAADGSLATPLPGPDYDRAGWYRFSPRPGAVGPAVVVGHIDSKAGGPSVFFRLGELKARDTISVERADGSVAVFGVDDVRRFHKSDFPTELVYGSTDHPALRLITCGGPFDRKTGHYLDNVVVTASLLRVV